MTDGPTSHSTARSHSLVNAHQPDSEPTVDSQDKAGRLKRWASLLEREPYQLIGLLRPSWAAGNDSSPMMACPSAIDIAWRDPVFRVTGLSSPARDDVRAFFGLSNAELDRIASGSWRVRARPACHLAARIRNVADPKSERLILLSVLAIIISVVGIAKCLL